MNRYEWIIFDYGGTLDADVDNPTGDRADMLDIYGEIILDWFVKNNIAVSATTKELQELAAGAHKATEGTPGQISLKYNIEYYSRWTKYIYRQLGITRYIPHTELEALRLFMLGEYMRRAGKTPARATFDTLYSLRSNGVRMGVLSNNNGYVEDMVANAGLSDYFEFAIDSARVGLVKPDRRIFDLAVNEYALNTKKTLYVGDDFENDVRGAIAAGWDAAWLTQKTSGPSEGLTYYKIENLSELVGINNGD